MKTFALLFAFASSLLLSSRAHALDFVDIQNWTGTGTNQAALVVDFADGGPAFAWGFRFDGAVTGFEMISAVAASDPLFDIQTTVYGGGLGNAITGIRYGTLARGGFEPGSAGYFQYFLAEGTTSQPTDWTVSPTGVGGVNPDGTRYGRILGNGSWDGHSWAPGFSGGAPSANIIAAAPVPEPATLGALVLGSLALSRRRKA